MKNQGKDVVSVRQFNTLRSRVKKHEDQVAAEIEELKEKIEDLSGPGKTEVPEKEVEGGWLDRVRGFVRRHPLFSLAGGLMIGYVLGCVVCDFSTFGGY